MYEAVVSAGGIALSPIPIAAMLVLLAGGQGHPSRFALAAGWTAGLGAATVGLFLLVQALGLGESSPRLLALAEIAFGLIFLAAGAVMWLRRGSPAQPRLIRGVENLTAPGSAALGLALVLANPKVLSLVFAAAIALVRAGNGAVWDAWALALFVVMAATGVVLPWLAALAFPSRAAMPLQALHRWLGRHEVAAIMLLALLVGVVFVVMVFDSWDLEASASRRSCMSVLILPERYPRPGSAESEPSSSVAWRRGVPDRARTQGTEALSLGAGQ